MDNLIYTTFKVGEVIVISQSLHPGNEWTLQQAKQKIWQTVSTYEALWEEQSSICENSSD